MITILTKEINEFLNSLVAYIAIGIFLTANGLILWVLPETNVLDYGYATLDPLFSLGPYVYLFLIPAITMRSFAEEKRNGTMEMLYTLPLRSWDIIAGKYLSSVVLVLFSLLPTVLYYYTLHQLGNPPGNLDTSGIIGSYLGLFLLGAVFSAIGLFSSALTDNQIISFIVAAFLCFMMYDGLQAVASIDIWGSWSYYLEQFGISFHYLSMSKGVLDLSDLAYFFGVIYILLSATKVVIEAKK